MSFFKKLIGKKEDKEPKRRASIKEETQKNKGKTTEIADEDTPKDLERVDTYAGPLTKFLLKFIFIEDSYREIEKAFLYNTKKKMMKLKKSKSIKSKMILKQSTKEIPAMLNILQFPKLTNKEIEIILNKDIKDENKLIIIDSKKDITFRRFLISVGQIYFELKSKQEKIDLNKIKNDENEDDNDDNNEDDIKNENNDNNNEKKDIYNKVGKGFDTVKNMFDFIDKDGSGFIDKDEFEKVFSPSLRGADKKKLLKERMDEMDYNKDGKISFKEFTFGIAQWIKWDIDDDYDDFE